MDQPDDRRELRTNIAYYCFLLSLPLVMVAFFLLLAVGMSTEPGPEPQNIAFAFLIGAFVVAALAGLVALTKTLVEGATKPFPSRKLSTLLFAIPFFAVLVPNLMWQLTGPYRPPIAATLVSGSLVAAFAACVVAGLIGLALSLWYNLLRRPSLAA